MVRFGTEPFLECSSKGDRRFSAFYARVELQGVIKSIEDWYQGYKVFEGGITGLNWKEAKGKAALNQEDARMYYSYLWDIYFDRNQNLYQVIKPYNGFTDIFGQEGHACQAEEVYRHKRSI